MPELLARVSLLNTSTDPLDGPVLAAYGPSAPASVMLISHDGTLPDPDGRVYLNFDTEIPTNGLGNGEASTAIAIECTNPQLARFTLDVALLAQGNRAPFFTSAPPIEALFGREYLYSATATDPDGHAITFSTKLAPVGLGIDPQTGVLLWTPALADEGVHEVVLVANDGRGEVARQSFSLRVVVAPDNRPPAFTSIPVTLTNPGADYSYQATASDPDGDPLSFSLEDGPVGMIIDPAGLVTWENAIAGDYSVAVRVSDPDGSHAIQAFALTVGGVATNPNAPRITSAPPVEAGVGLLYLYPVVATDADNDPLTYSLPTAPAGMMIEPANGLITWTPTIGQLGPQAVLVSVTDPGGATATQFYTIGVVLDLANRAPRWHTVQLAASDPFGLRAVQAFIIEVTTSDRPKADQIRERRRNRRSPA